MLLCFWVGEIEGSCKGSDTNTNSNWLLMQVFLVSADDLWVQQLYSLSTIQGSSLLLFRVVPLTIQGSFTLWEQHMVRRTQGRKRGGGWRRSDESRNWGWNCVDPLRQRCPLGAAGDECSLSLLSNLSFSGSMSWFHWDSTTAVPPGTDQWT